MLHKPMPLLDIGRLLAAFAVALTHLSLIFDLGWNDVWATAALSWFFVLSGFIMAYTHPECRPTPKELSDFWTRRIIRIVPAYWIALMLAVIWLAWGVGQYGAHWFQVVGRPEFLIFDIDSDAYLSDWQLKSINHFLFLGIFDEASSGRFLFSPPFWSLYSEMFFYLLFPFIMPLVLYTRNEWGLKLAFVLWLLQGLIILLIVEQLPNRDFVTMQASVYSNPLIRLIEFVVGILICHWLKSANHENLYRLRSPLSIVTNLLCLAGIIMVSPMISTPFNLYWIVIPILAWNILILSQKGFPYTKLSVAAGGTSYIIYLFHWTLWEVGYAMGLRIDSLSVLIGLIMLLIIFSFLLWRFVDAPLRKELSLMVKSCGFLHQVDPASRK